MVDHDTASGRGGGTTSPTTVPTGQQVHTTFQPPARVITAALAAVSRQQGGCGSSSSRQAEDDIERGQKYGQRVVLDFRRCDLLVLPWQLEQVFHGRVGGANFQHNKLQELQLGGNFLQNRALAPLCFSTTSRSGTSAAAPGNDHAEHSLPCFLPSLRVLGLQKNRLSGVLKLDRLPGSLEELYLNENRLEGLQIDFCAHRQDENVATAPATLSR
ncbi:unnamed protein product, partial [Amoebophrya sp. A120]|eukprot:GSA120T00023879001.1